MSNKCCWLYYFYFNKIVGYFSLNTIGHCMLSLIVIIRVYREYVNEYQLVIKLVVYWLVKNIIFVWKNNTKTEFNHVYISLYCIYICSSTSCETSRKSFVRRAKNVFKRSRTSTVHWKAWLTTCAEWGRALTEPQTNWRCTSPLALMLTPSNVCKTNSRSALLHFIVYCFNLSD